MPCRGIAVTQNTFSNNFGCPKYGGSLIKLECIPDETLLKANNIYTDEALKSNLTDQ